MTIAGVLPSPAARELALFVAVADRTEVLSRMRTLADHEATDPLVGLYLMTVSAEARDKAGFNRGRNIVATCTEHGLFGTTMEAERFWHACAKPAYRTWQDSLPTLAARTAVWEMQAGSALTLVADAALVDWHERIVQNRTRKTDRKTYFSKLFSPHWPQMIGRYADAAEMESRLDFKAADAERAPIMSKLSTALGRSELEDILTYMLRAKYGEISVAEYYIQLKQVLNQNGIPIDQFPGTKAYIGYCELTVGLDARMILGVIWDAEIEGYSRLAVFPAQERAVADTLAVHLVQRALLYATGELPLARIGEARTQSPEDARAEVHALIRRHQRKAAWSWLKRR